MYRQSLFPALLSFACTPLVLALFARPASGQG